MALGRAVGIGVVAFVSLVVSRVSPAGLVLRDSLPDRLTDTQFWQLTEQMSEPGGSFRSDNFLSNERGYQVVIPDLMREAVRAASTWASAPSRTSRTSSRSSRRWQ